MKVRNKPVMYITKTKKSLSISPDDNPSHEAKVPGYDLHVGDLHNLITVGPLTRDDLKMLRKILRMTIRNEDK